MRSEIENVIVEIRKRYREELSLDELADIACLSPFHLSRLFRRETGLSPGRYVSAVRLEEAKRLLLTTESSISRISAEVGYSSLGTFTSRFTDRIGISPGRYRRISSLGLEPHDNRFSDQQPRRYGTICGEVGRAHAGPDTPVFVGIFRASDQRCHPTGCKVVSSGMTWKLENVPTGHWFVHAVSLEGPGGPHSLAVAGLGPVEILPGRAVSVSLALSPHQVQPEVESASESGVFSLPEIFSDVRVS